VSEFRCAGLIPSRLVPPAGFPRELRFQRRWQSSWCPSHSESWRDYTGKWAPSIQSLRQRLWHQIHSAGVLNPSFPMIQKAADCLDRIRGPLRQPCHSGNAIALGRGAGNIIANIAIALGRCAGKCRVREEKHICVKRGLQSPKKASLRVPVSIRLRMFIGGLLNRAPRHRSTVCRTLDRIQSGLASNPRYKCATVPLHLCA